MDVKVKLSSMMAGHLRVITLGIGLAISAAVLVLGIGIGDGTANHMAYAVPNEVIGGPL